MIHEDPVLFVRNGRLLRAVNFPLIQIVQMDWGAQTELSQWRRGLHTPETPLAPRAQSPPTAEVEDETQDRIARWRQGFSRDTEGAGPECIWSAERMQHLLGSEETVSEAQKSINCWDEQLRHAEEAEAEAQVRLRVRTK